MHHVRRSAELAHARWKSRRLLAVVSLSFGVGETTARRVKQKYPGYEISQYNIIVDVLGGWSTDVEVAVKELVGRRQRDILKKMQRAYLSVTLNIARTFKVAIH